MIRARDAALKLRGLGARRASHCLSSRVNAKATEKSEESLLPSGSGGLPCTAARVDDGSFHGFRLCPWLA